MINNKGFSLLEVMIVVAVLGIVSSIIIGMMDKDSRKLKDNTVVLQEKTKLKCICTEE